jgi:hypothetical protein
MPPTVAEQPTAGDVHDLISALKPDQERLAELSKQLQQMENGTGFMDKLRAFRHGGVEKAMEKLRDQIADVQQEMFDKVAHDQVSASQGLSMGDASDPQALKNQMARFQDQLAVDDHFKQAGMPGILHPGQRQDLEKFVQDQGKKLQALEQQSQGPQHEQAGQKVSVRESLSHGKSLKPPGHGTDGPRVRGQSV